MNMISEKELAEATARWIERKKGFGYEKLFSESLLILPIAEYFRGNGWKVDGDTDCYYLVGSENVEREKGQINYDFCARKQEHSDEITILK